MVLTRVKTANLTIPETGEASFVELAALGSDGKPYALTLDETTGVLPMSSAFVAALTRVNIAQQTPECQEAQFVLLSALGSDGKPYALQVDETTGQIPVSGGGGGGTGDSHNPVTVSNVTNGSISFTCGTNQVLSGYVIPSNINHDSFANLNGNSNVQHLTAAQVAGLHAAVTISNDSNSDVSLTLSGQQLTTTIGATSLAGPVTSTRPVSAINQISSSISSEGRCGISAWSGTGAYYSWTAGNPGTLTLLRGGSGYVRGKSITFAGGQSITIAYGQRFIVYIDSSGILQKQTDDTKVHDGIYLFFAQNDANGDAIQIRQDHDYLTDTGARKLFEKYFGVVISSTQGSGDISRYGTGTGASTTDRMVNIAAGELHDADLTETWSAILSGIFINHTYINSGGAALRYSYSQQFPMLYNLAGTPTAIAAGSRGVFRLYVTKSNKNDGLPQFITEMNTAEYNTLANANTAIGNGTISNISGQSPELAQLAYIVVRNQGGGYIESITIAKKTVQAIQGGGGGATPSAATTTTTTTAFNGVLSSSDTTVQSALDTLDNIPSTALTWSAKQTFAGGADVTGMDLRNNLVKNPNGELSRTADVTLGAGIVAPTDSPTPLIGSKSFRLTGVATAGVTTWWQFDLKAVDSFYAGKPLSFSLKTSASVASAFRVSVYNVTDATELIETQVVIPGGNYEAKGFFIPVAGKAYGLRITQITNGTATCDVDDVYVGEVPVRYGQAVTDWQSYTPTFEASFGTVTGIQFWWRRVGDSVQVQGKFVAGTTTAGNAEISLPGGIVTDAKCTLASMAGTYITTNTTAAKIGGIAPRPTYSVVYLDNDATSIPSTSSIIETGVTVTVMFTVAIVGWSSNVQQADRALEEFAYNSSSSVGDDSTSFAYGMAGALFLSYAATGLSPTKKRIRFQNAIQPNDKLTFEIKDPATGIWAGLGDGNPNFQIQPTQFQNTVAYGTHMVPINSTDIDVAFFQYARVAGNTAYGAAGSTWPTTYSWRVRKVSGGAQVGFPISAANIVGQTTTPASGMIGESISASGNVSPASGVYGTMASITLTAGNWLITAGAYPSPNSSYVSTNQSAISIKIDSSSGTNYGTDFNSAGLLTANYGGPATSLSRPLNVPVGTTKTAAIEAKAFFSAGSVAWYGSIFAIRFS